MQKNELLHYGVKGMKWGVRRAYKLASKTKRKIKEIKDLDKRIKKDPSDLSLKNARNYSFSKVDSYRKKSAKSVQRLDSKINKTNNQSKKKKLKKVRSIYDRTIKEIDKEIVDSGRDFIYRTYF